MADLSLSLFGPFLVTIDGAPIPELGSAKARALLAYLAAEADRPHRRELWPRCCGRNIASPARERTSARRCLPCAPPWGTDRLQRRRIPRPRALGYAPRPRPFS